MLSPAILLLFACSATSSSFEAHLFDILLDLPLVESCGDQWKCLPKASVSLECSEVFVACPGNLSARKVKEDSSEISKG
jgi:hypothetical protein